MGQRNAGGENIEAQGFDGISERDFCSTVVRVKKKQTGQSMRKRTLLKRLYMYTRFYTWTGITSSPSGETGEPSVVILSVFPLRMELTRIGHGGTDEGGVHPHFLLESPGRGEVRIDSISRDRRDIVRCLHRDLGAVGVLLLVVVV